MVTIQQKNIENQLVSSLHHMLLVYVLGGTYSLSSFLYQRLFWNYFF